MFDTLPVYRPTPETEGKILQAIGERLACETGEIIGDRIQRGDGSASFHCGCRAAGVGPGGQTLLRFALSEV